MEQSVESTEEEKEALTAEYEYNEAWDEDENKAGEDTDEVGKKADGSNSVEQEEESETLDGVAREANKESSSDDLISLLREKGVKDETLDKISEFGNLDGFVDSLTARKNELDLLKKDAEAGKRQIDTDSEISKLRSKFSEYDSDILEAMEPLFQKLSSMETGMSSFKADIETKNQNEKAQNDFILGVVPKLSEANRSDCIDIFKSEDYHKWADKQSPAMKFAALQSGDPVDIDSAINAFKLDTNEATKSGIKRSMVSKSRNLKSMEGLRGNDQVPNLSNQKDDKSDYDAGWNEASDVIT